MAFWKAPGNDVIPVDLFCQCKSCVVPLLHDILVKVGGKVWYHNTCCKIITLYENKSVRSAITTQGVSPNGIAGKKLAHVIISCLQKLFKRVFPEL